MLKNFTKHLYRILYPVGLFNLAMGLWGVVDNRHTSGVINSLFGGGYLLLAGYLDIRNYLKEKRRQEPSSINGLYFEYAPDEDVLHLQVQKGSLKDTVGEVRNEEGVTVFTNLAQDLMCYVPRKGFTGKFRRPRELSYGEKVRFGEDPYLLFGYGKPEVRFRIEVRKVLLQPFPPNSDTHSSQN